MHKFCSLIAAAVLLLVAGVSSLQAQDGLGDAFSRLNSTGVITNTLIGPAVATADFDNDRHPDGAILFRRNNAFQIEVHFRSARVSTITFASRLTKLAISAFDVNHDGSLDLVVEEPFSHQRLFIWLNDGYGSFRSAHPDDYPAQSADSYRNFGRPTRVPHSQAAVVFGKSRIRGTSSTLRWPPASTDLFHRSRQPSSPLLQFTSAPGLLRGPPTGIPL
jgi:hypothetical protein